MKSNKSLIGLLAIVVGVLFIVMKGEVVSLAITALGITAIVLGILDIVKRKNNSGVLEIAVGIAIIVCGWLVTSIALYVIAGLMIVYCIGNLVTSLRTDGYPMSTVQTIRTYAKPIIGLIAGLCLLFNQGGTVSWAFVVAGIIFVVEGIMMLSECRR